MAQLNLRWYAAWIVFVVLVAAAIVAWTPGYVAPSALVLLLFTVLLVEVSLLARCVAPDPFDVDSRLPVTASETVDPWELQRHLMGISGQALPELPTLTKASLMYAALIAEEGAETFRDLVAPVERLLVQAQRQEAPAAAVLALQVIRYRFAQLAQQMKSDSKLIRSELDDLSDFRLGLTDQEARALLDDASDLCVVDCGFALSTGLPGPEGYAEVNSSNISKADPVTGRIEKEPNGKWIKGPAYQEPDLIRVLREQRLAMASSHL